MAIKTYNITAADAATSIVIPLSRYVTVVYSTTKGGTATAGTVTIKASAPTSDAFSAVDGISAIDLAAPEPQTITGPLAERLELTLAGFAGTASELVFSVIYEVA